MNLIKKIYTLCLALVLPFIFCACNKTNPPSNLSLYGVLIYQKTETNEAYENNKLNVEKLVTIKDSTISTNNTYLLYFNYDNNTNTNTTHILEDDTLSLEIFIETTEITTCLIYKDEDNNLYYLDTKTHTITNENTTIYNLTNHTIIVSKNLSYKKG